MPPSGNDYCTTGNNPTYNFVVDNDDGFEILAGEGAAANVLLKFLPRSCTAGGVDFDLLQYTNFTVDGMPISPIATVNDTLIFDISDLIGNLQVDSSFHFNVDIINTCFGGNCPTVPATPICPDPTIVLEYSDVCSLDFRETFLGAATGDFPFFNTEVNTNIISYDQPSYCTPGEVEVQYDYIDLSTSTIDGINLRFLLDIGDEDGPCALADFNNFRIYENGGAEVAVPMGNVSMLDDTTMQVSLTGMGITLQDEDTLGLRYSIEMLCSHSSGSNPCYHPEGFCDVGDPTLVWESCQGLPQGRTEIIDEFFFDYNRNEAENVNNLYAIHPSPYINADDQNVFGNPAHAKNNNGTYLDRVNCNTWRLKYLYQYGGLDTCDNTEVRAIINLPSGVGFVSSTMPAVYDVATNTVTISSGKIESNNPNELLTFDFRTDIGCLTGDYGNLTYSVVYECSGGTMPGCSCEFQRSCGTYFVNECGCGGGPPPPPIVPDPCLRVDELTLTRTSIGLGRRYHDGNGKRPTGFGQRLTL